MVCWIKIRLDNGDLDINRPPTEDELKLHAQMAARGMADEIKIERLDDNGKQKIREIRLG